jgi:murein L,D-transpeptidase YafK
VPRAALHLPRLALTSLVLALTLLASIGVRLPSARGAANVREPTAWQGDRRWSGKERLAGATSRRAAEVERLFAAAGAPYPPTELLFRVYKAEAELEVWAGDGQMPLRRVTTYGICAASGALGPKRAEGDLQVPEGFYELAWFHPESAFHLAALVDYPNRSDRIRGAATPGGQIMLHGGCASIGCVAMSDERIEELYLMAWSTFTKRGARTQIHIFPARDFDALLADEGLARHHAFWREIRVGHDAFEETRRLPHVSIDPRGAYVFGRAGEAGPESSAPSTRSASRSKKNLSSPSPGSSTPSDGQ